MQQVAVLGILKLLNALIIKFGPLVVSILCSQKQKFNFAYPFGGTLFCVFTLTMLSPTWSKRWQVYWCLELWNPLCSTVKIALLIWDSCKFSDSHKTHFECQYIFIYIPVFGNFVIPFSFKIFHWISFLVFLWPIWSTQLCKTVQDRLC